MLREVGLADREREVGLGKEEVEAHGRHQRGDESGASPAELGHHDGEGEEDEGEVGRRHHRPERDQHDAEAHRPQRSRDGPDPDVVGSTHDFVLRGVVLSRVWGARRVPAGDGPDGRGARHGSG